MTLDKHFIETDRNDPSNLEFTTMTGVSNEKICFASYNFPWDENDLEKDFIPAKILYKKTTEIGITII